MIFTLLYNITLFIMTICIKHQYRYHFEQNKIFIALFNRNENVRRKECSSGG